MVSLLKGHILDGLSTKIKDISAVRNKEKKKKDLEVPVTEHTLL